MMLTLYLLRHAKSDKGAPGMADIDRPLSERGRHEAQVVAEHMAARGYRPDRILCSRSLRTRETLTPIIPMLKSDADVEFVARIYDATVETLLATIREPRDVNSLMIIGHNPGLEQLARALAATGDADSLARLRAMFPPASLAVIGFGIREWAEITPGSGRLEAFETPAG